MPLTTTVTEMRNTTLSTTMTTQIMSSSSPSTGAYEPLPSTAHLDRICYLFGEPIAHSLSPVMHQTIYDSVGLKWSQHRFSSHDIPHFISVTRADPKFRGSAVTMPNKIAIMPYLDEITEEAKAVGAVNTIFLRDDDARDVKRRKFVGTNTDVVGITESFYQNVRDGDTLFNNRPALVIGGGGAARSAVFALHRYMKCSPIYIANRDPSEVEAVISHCQANGYGDSLVHLSSAAQAQDIAPVAAIVSCIPDFAPVTEGEWATRRILETILAKDVEGMPNGKGVILEMAYHPHPITAVSTLSTNAGWQVLLGTEAMIYQGLVQSSLWTGKALSELPVEAVRKVITERLAGAGVTSGR